ncbi:hypothetical protein QQZ08_001187 [Neonectria magnoliae]|uniref:Uncharacterized protein n=1 Tax=Neonectria magnoliae TaxID=2732573 RepID=A0ABR1IHH5_9HYPO
MDFIKKAVSGGSSSQQHNTQQHNTQQNGNKQDYVDKAFGMASKKSGRNVDHNTAEKITDAGRGLFEKVTGKKVDPKYSN